MSHDTQVTNPEGVMGLLLRLRGIGITDPDFLKLVESVPHDKFVPVEYFSHAWKDVSLPLRCGQTLPSPDMMARLLYEARIAPSHTVLEIGTGSGYLTALLARNSRKVVSLDRYRMLIEDARTRMQAISVSNVTFEHADGRKGGAEQGLYDRIVCDSAFDEMPRQLSDHLVAGGEVITALGAANEEQMLVRLTKIGNRFDRQDLFPVRFGVLEEGKSAAL